jgi:hypothetical protein
MLKRFVPILLAGCIAGIFSASASAESTGPIWKIMAVSNPTNLKPGDKAGGAALLLAVTNVGGGATDGSPIIVSDALPPGLKAVGILGVNPYKQALFNGDAEEEGSPEGLDCSLVPAPRCTVSEPLDPGDTLLITIKLSVETTTEGSSEVNDASVSGGGAVGMSVSDPVTIGSALLEYGMAKGGLLAASSTSQAGAHPNVTASYFLNTINKTDDSPQEIYAASEPVGPSKDVHFDLPPGLVGTTVGMPRCTMAQVADKSACPRDTMVGTAILIVSSGTARYTMTLPVFNIAPATGEPAAFAFDALFFPVRLDTSVLSNGEYNVRFTAPDITTGAGDYFSSITIWGVPAEHYGPGPDAGATSLGAESPYTFGGSGIENKEGYEFLADQRVALVTNPSQCSVPLVALLETDSWEASGPGVFASEPVGMGMATGCGQLSFKPTVSMLPDTLEAGAPAGYSFDLNVPQDTEAGGLATPDVKKVVASLPLGTVISPSAADGLGDCSNAQFGLHSGVPGECPHDSQVGTVRIQTPALEERLQGAVYLATPECDPCTPRDAADGKMVRLFVQVVGEGESGIVVKLEGTGRINQQTGQLTTTFDDNPQLPFSEFQLILQGGERATLANPRSCGPVSTAVDLTPWSTPFTPDATPTSTFDIDENCFGPQFNPSFTAGTTSNQAGNFSPLTVSFGRSDSDEFLNGLQVKMPPGLLGMLSKVTLCGEPQAAQGTCGPESLIGETTVETGPGADPFVVTGGKVYITGSYRGAPYGLSIVVPAVAGPYTLAGTTGHGTVVVRSAINVNPETSQLTVTADPLPTELDGIPLQLRLVNVTINRPEFTFNPTSCDRLTVAATLTSTQAASASASSSFQVTNCGAMKFKPSFAVSTSGKTSKANGASLDARLTFPAGSQGSEANFARVKVELPKQLPSRLTTLQKACTSQTFDVNPANCPGPSVIGIAKVSTPVLPVQLSGPVYFVSNGGEAFPNLIMVLQGDGVRVDLIGDTYISHKGITSTTFKTVPDVPFSAFELYLPEGPYSALAANGDLCKSKLVMPDEFIAQDGAAIHQSTRLAVTGCNRAAAKKKTKRKANKASRAQKSGARDGRTS